MTSRPAKRRLLLSLCTLAALLFAALGVWQVQRLRWKLDLIARVDARVHAPAMPIPPRADWPRLDVAALEYRHVRATGLFRNDKETLVDALTELGPGYWVITPLRTADGTILVNRGFVPADRADRTTRSASETTGPVAITGLLRTTEPGGRALRPNRPAQNRWFSRDVDAIARERGIGSVAPFFIDADSTRNQGGLPIGGLTVIHFRNAHLAYALTWFALAALSMLGLALVAKGGQDRH